MLPFVNLIKVEKEGGIRTPEGIDLMAPPSNKTALSSSFPV